MARAQAPDPLGGESPRALILWTIAMTMLAIVLAWTLFVVRQVLLLVYVSALLAIGFSPLVRVIERQTLLPIGSRIPRWLAILIVYVVILGALTAIGFVVLPPFVHQAREFVTHLPSLAERAQRYLIQHDLLTERKTVGEMVQQSPAGSDMVGAVLLTFWGFIGGLFGLVTILMLTFYLLVDSAALFDAFLRLFPRHRQARLDAAARQITVKVSSWLSGQLMLAAVVGSTSAVVLGLIGLPYFYVLALIAAIGEMIPYVGPLLAAAPGIAIAAGVSWKLALGVGLFYLAQQQLEANLLVPKLMERQVGLSPAVVIVALLIGAALLGIAGAILAVPTAAILRVVLQEIAAAGEADYRNDVTGSGAASGAGGRR